MVTRSNRRAASADPDEDDGELELLLRPSLDPRLDVRRFHRPFEPHGLLWACFFGGPVAGGLMYGWNYKRLGSMRAALACWLGALPLGILVVLAVSAAMGFDLDGERKREFARAARLALTGTALVAGWLICRHQRPLFEAHQSADLRKGRALWPGFFASLVGFIANVFLLSFAMMGAGVDSGSLE